MSEFIEKYKEVSGREVATEEEAVQHFKNLEKLAFAKQEDMKKEAKTELEVEFRETEAAKIKEAEDKIKAEYEPFKSFVEQAGIKDLSKVNPLAIAEYIGEQHEDIKPRTDVVDTQIAQNELEAKIKNGRATQDERNAYMRMTVLKGKK